MIYTEYFIDIYTLYFTNFKELPLPLASQLKLISVSMKKKITKKRSKEKLTFQNFYRQKRET